MLSTLGQWSDLTKLLHSTVLPVCGCYRGANQCSPTHWPGKGCCHGRVVAMGRWLSWAGGCHGQVVVMGGWLPWVGIVVIAD